MNFSQLSNILSKEFGFSKSLSQRIIKVILKTIVTELKQNKLVRLRNFGTFVARRSYGKVRAKFDDSDNFFKNDY